MAHLGAVVGALGLTGGAGTVLVALGTPHETPAPSVRDVAQLLDIDVEHRAGVGVLIAAHDLPAGPMLQLIPTLTATLVCGKVDDQLGEECMQGQRTGLVWALVGAGVSLLIISWPLVGAVAVVAAVTTSLTMREPTERLSRLFFGGAVPLLVVAWLHRRGPGLVSGTSETGGWTQQYLDPRPWLIAGLVLLILALSLKAGSRNTQPTKRAEPAPEESGIN